MTIWDEASKQERDEISRLSIEHGSPAGAAITLLRRLSEALERDRKGDQIIHELTLRLDSLSAAVRKAWQAHREGDMWQALGGAMDIVDPERNEQPIRAVEKRRDLFSELKEGLESIPVEKHGRNSE